MDKKPVVEELAKFGQSVWVDNISRSMIDSGKLKGLIDQGLMGMTSNPTIFNKAVTSSSDYDEKILHLCDTGKSTFEIYDDLTVKDIQDAADIFLPLHKKTNGLDGFVSLEVNPRLAFDAQKSVEEAKRLYKKVNRPNVMFKVPSTEEGFQAIEELVACGMNINVTLIFSLKQYINSAEAYIRGLKRRIKNKQDIAGIRSVASVFVSRVDTAADKLLDAAGAAALKGKAAWANCNIIYEKYAQIFSSAEFNQLKKCGANTQRVLWGSTSTKNPAYSDIKYVTELIAKDTVNTMPENTFEAFLDHGAAEEAITADAKDAKKIISELKSSGIDIDKVCAKLLQEGVVAFIDSFDTLLNAIEGKTKKVCNR